MDAGRKRKLIELGVDRLAEALLELTSRDAMADSLVERMIATPQENVMRFKASLAGIKRSRRFIRWGESAAFARELRSLLDDLQAAVTDPRTGAELVAAFYECDKGALGNCDDSSGHVGDIFRYDAREIFLDYASRCDDKEWLGDLLFKLNRTDDYGVRDSLIKHAAEFLTEPVLRSLVKRFQQQADKESAEYGKRHWLMLVESLARQLKDAPLFEQTRIASWGSLSTAACIDIARVYFESGDCPTALAWLEKIPQAETFMADERDELLLKVYEQIGNASNRADITWRMFRRDRNLHSLDRLLEVIGSEQKDSVVAGEVVSILAATFLSLADTTFLVSVERFDEAETYMFDHADQLNGDHYTLLLPLAEAMEKNSRLLCASLLYRSLLDSILRRAQTKTYSYGVRYLKKLDLLAGSITGWGTIEPHAVYKAELQLHHGRKSSFWSRYVD